MELGFEEPSRQRGTSLLPVLGFDSVSRASMLDFDDSAAMNLNLDICRTAGRRG